MSGAAFLAASLLGAVCAGVVAFVRVGVRAFLRD
jgi:hypothetical protein